MSKILYSARKITQHCMKKEHACVEKFQEGGEGPSPGVALVRLFNQIHNNTPDSSNDKSNPEKLKKSQIAISVYKNKLILTTT